MRTVKTHVQINAPGGTFATTACGRVLLAGAGGDRVRSPFEYGFGLVTLAERCRSCDKAYPLIRASAERRELPWQQPAT